MSTKRATNQRLEQTLVEFFRDEGHVLGTEGDDAMRTPVEQALHSMRELLKFRSELSKARSKGKMRLAVPETCTRGHMYYREAHAETDCPYCLKASLHTLQERMRRAREGLSIVWGQLQQ